MATYKVIQDIEAEDKILGPLTLKQFIFALVATFFLYLCFVSLTKGALFLLALFLPPALFCLFFAFPFGRDQPTDVWAAAKIQFLFKPRRRIWDQSGVKELVTITVPKKIERVYTDGLSQSEVKSRLKALANTIDTRGWAIKNVGTSIYTQPGYAVIDGESDRLVNITAMPQAVPDYDAGSSDILDDSNSVVAQQFTQMISASEHAHRQQLMDRLNDVRTSEATNAQVPPAANFWFTGSQQTPQPPVQANPADSGMPTADEIELVDRLKSQNNSQQIYNAHMRTIQPLTNGSTQTAPSDDHDEPAAATPPQPDPAILKLANNNDLNVSTLAREASRAKNPQEPQDEVVISLR